MLSDELIGRQKRKICKLPPPCAHPTHTHNMMSAISSTGLQKALPINKTDRILLTLDLYSSEETDNKRPLGTYILVGRQTINKPKMYNARAEIKPIEEKIKPRRSIEDSLGYYFRYCQRRHHGGGDI